MLDSWFISTNTTDGFDEAIHIDDGTDSEFLACTIDGNIITDSGTPINITTGYNATASVISNNFIEAQASATGVLEAAGETFVINNVIVTGAGGDGISVLHWRFSR